MQTLTHLYLGGTKVNDVSSLKGLRLTTLELYSTNVSNLESLKDLNLTLLRINGTLVTNLSPIRGMRLTNLSCDFKKERDAEILRSITTLGEINGKSASQFWKEVDAGTYVSPVFDDAWVRQVAKMTAKEQVEAVKVQLMKRNPGFDGKMSHKIESGEVTSLEFLTDQVIDIRPVRALLRLKELSCNGTPGKGQLTDLTPLLDLKLTVLDCSNNKVADLTPLQEMPLIDLRCDFNAARDAKILRSIQTLETINGQSVQDFWNAVDKKEP